MDTDDLSNETYEAILITAERFNHDLMLRFGCLASACKNEAEYLIKAEEWIQKCLEHEDMECLMEDIIFGNSPNENDFITTLASIIINIKKVKNDAD